MNNNNSSRYRPGLKQAGLIDQIYNILEKAKNSKDAPKLKSSELDPVNVYVRQGFCVTEDDFIHPLDLAFSEMCNLFAARAKILSLWNETGQDPASKYVAGLVVNNAQEGISLRSPSDVYSLLDEIYETKMPDSVIGKDPVNAMASNFYEASCWFESPNVTRSQFTKALEQLIGADRLDQKFFKDPVNAFVGDPIKEDPIAPEKKTTGIPPVQLQENKKLNSTPAKSQDKPNADKPADRLDPAMAEVMEAISKKKKLGFQSGQILSELVADKTGTPAALKHLMSTLRTYKDKIKQLLR